MLRLTGLLLVLVGVWLFGNQVGYARGKAECECAPQQAVEPTIVKEVVHVFERAKACPKHDDHHLRAELERLRIALAERNAERDAAIRSANDDDLDTVPGELFRECKTRLGELAKRRQEVAGEAAELAATARSLQERAAKVCVAR